jgi:hypothetical protein
MRFDFRKANVGDSDRAVRFFLGFAFIFIGLSHHSLTPGVIGAILIMTGYLRTCPVYSLIDFSSKKG